MAMRGNLFHQSVLLREALEALNIRPEDAYVDGTFGRGGHASAILNTLGAQGQLIALDRDPEAERFAKTYFSADPRFSFTRVNFGRLAEVVDKHKLRRKIKGILLDIGVSSPQLEDPERGFSFSKEGPLDMRMDPSIGMSAAEWLASCNEKELSWVLKEFSQERFHRRIARAVIAARQAEPITTTSQLAQIITAAIPNRERGQHPATRSFQAIRIFINQELTELQSALEQALQVLAPDGRLVVISFHSLEDRVVKRFMRSQTQGLQSPLDLPVPAAQSTGSTLRLIGRALRPNAEEIRGNPRARSAVLRVAERLA